MSKLRVYELAKELNIKPQDVLDSLQGTQYEVKTSSNSIDEDAQKLVRSKVLPGPNRSIVKIRTAVKPINKPVTYTLIDYSDPETLKALANVAAKGGKQTAKTNVRAQKHGGKGGK